MLRPYGSVIYVASEISKSLDGRCISSRGESDARNEPIAIDFATIGTLDEPLLLVLIELSSVNVFIEGNVFGYIPFLIDVFEVSS